MKTPSLPPHRLSEKSPAAGTAICAVCGPVEIYTFQHKDGRSDSFACKNAHNSRKGMKSRRWETKKRAHGLTTDEARKLREGKFCEICGAPAQAVDHDHITKKRRGLLCLKCNLVLGHMDDEPELLDQAAAYLRKYSEASQEHS